MQPNRGPVPPKGGPRPLSSEEASNDEREHRIFGGRGRPPPVSPIEKSREQDRSAFYARERQSSSSPQIESRRKVDDKSSGVHNRKTLPRRSSPAGLRPPAVDPRSPTFPIAKDDSAMGGRQQREKRRKEESGEKEVEEEEEKGEKGKSAVAARNLTGPDPTQPRKRGGVPISRNIFPTDGTFETGWRGDKNDSAKANAKEKEPWWKVSNSDKDDSSEEHEKTLLYQSPPANPRAPGSRPPVAHRDNTRLPPFQIAAHGNDSDDSDDEWFRNHEKTRPLDVAGEKGGSQRGEKRRNEGGSLAEGGLGASSSGAGPDPTRPHKKVASNEHRNVVPTGGAAETGQRGNTARKDDTSEKEAEKERSPTKKKRRYSSKKTREDREVNRAATLPTGELHWDIPLAQEREYFLGVCHLADAAIRQVIEMVGREERPPPLNRHMMRTSLYDSVSSPLNAVMDMVLAMQTEFSHPGDTARRASLTDVLPAVRAEYRTLLDIGSPSNLSLRAVIAYARELINRVRRDMPALLGDVTRRDVAFVVLSVLVRSVTRINGCINGDL